MKKGGVMDVLPKNMPANLLKEGKGDTPTTVNLDLRNLQIQVSISEELSRVTERVTKLALAAELRDLEQRLDSKYGRRDADNGQSFVE